MLAVSALALGGSLIAQGLPESIVKAEMIRRFPEFVEWPPATLSPDDHITLCFSPSHPFGTSIATIAKGPKVRGHRLQVRELKKGEGPDGCHVLYVASAERTWLDKVKESPTLTIGDQPDFCHLGGIINLRVIDGRVRFEVNVGQARKVGLKFDSQFLRLATTLFGGRP